MVGRVLGVLLGATSLSACSGGREAPSPVGPTGLAVLEAGTPPSGSSLPGTYAATLALPACLGLPEAERMRRYIAQIDRDEATGVHVVSLSGATFLDTGPSRFHPVPLTANQFLATHDGGAVSFTLWGDWESSYGGHIIERTASGQWIDVQGHLIGQFGSRAIVASGAGSVYYCESATPSFYCEDAKWVTCDTRLTLTLVPQ